MSMEALANSSTRFELMTMCIKSSAGDICTNMPHWPLKSNSETCQNHGRALIGSLTIWFDIHSCSDWKEETRIMSEWQYLTWLAERYYKLEKPTLYGDSLVISNFRESNICARMKSYENMKMFSSRSFWHSEYPEYFVTSWAVPVKQLPLSLYLS